MNVRVSIIIPIYNVEQYIAKCAHSLFKQTYQHIEFIFVDDFSSDSSMFILKKIMEEYSNRVGQIILIKKEKNEGLPQARKTGFEKSTGDFIIYADSDDWLELDMIEKMAKKAIQENADIVWCDYFENEKYMTACPKTDDKTEIFKGFFNFDLHSSVCNKLVKREVYSNKIYFPNAMQNEDFVISIQNLFYAKKVSFINEALYHYRINSNSLSFSRERLAKRASESYENFIWIVNFLKDKFGDNLNFLEPHLSYRINFTKMKIMEAEETRDVKKLYELYPNSLNHLFIKYKKIITFVQAVMLFLAMKNILFPYKLVDWWRGK